MIIVNGKEIADAAILAEMQYHPAPSREAAYAEAAEALVVRELLLQRAAALGLEWRGGGVESEEQAIEAVLKHDLRMPVADRESCLRYYNNNPEKFRSQTLFEAAHILYPAPAENAEARSTARAAAEAALGILKEHPERFAEIARAESKCSSAGEGGRLGQFALGDTAPELETFLLALDEGQICPVPVETKYGFHVLRLDRRIEGRTMAFEDVEVALAAELSEKSWRRAVSQHISLLAGQADIQGIEIRRATSPLVQ